MFDPTAFDNMKVVIEGALYDRDLSGEIVITDRNDMLNIAKMSRLFNLCFRLPENKGSVISAKIEIEALLNNLAAELLPGSVSNRQAGCYVSLHFFLEKTGTIDFEALQAILSEIWGANRKVTQTVQSNPLEEEKKYTTIMTVEFDRIISEDQMDDLIEMIDFMIITVKQLQSMKGNRLL
ncbi:hypothetical protein BACCIP111895_02743 [Neobacillus rhizosphaerae]|uniref:Group-specific protein n=1 Tax=Neobacillus rhizosphaerae TaxID=2880965 RepID=A0ABN8KPY4_9BACI|nr:hypothetical protein [Neobacillus rhizosphaerae]CAH2715559.1 hypothetical protein BACCIP111895_02743 [Neobacillus rhizosphaerae]